jgi:hypothetical protein
LESSGRANSIHCSEATKELLETAGKGSWLKPRDEKIHLKGLGEVSTYWVTPKENTSSVSSESVTDGTFSDARIRRLVAWNVEVVYSLLENVVAHRQAKKKNAPRKSCTDEARGDLIHAEQDLMAASGERIVIDELTQILEMAEFDKETVLSKKPAVIKPCVKEQLHAYIASIAELYRNDVPFHNFEHVSHVLMSAEKLMKRIMKPEGIDYKQVQAGTEEEQEVAIAREIHKASPMRSLWK